MSTIAINNQTSFNMIFIKNTSSKKKKLNDFKKYIISSWINEVENISENIDKFIYN